MWQLLSKIGNDECYVSLNEKGKIPLELSVKPANSQHKDAFVQIFENQYPKYKAGQWQFNISGETVECDIFKEGTRNDKVIYRPTKKTPKVK